MMDRRSLTSGLAALAALMAMPAVAAPTPIPASAARRVLLVVQQGGPSMAVDQALRDHLLASGFAVEMADQRAGPSAATGFDLVILSSTVAAKDVDPAWRRSPVPLLTWENDCLDDLAMTGKRHDLDFGEAEKERYLWIVNAPHPMAGGLSAGLANVYAKQAPMSWGKPGLGAITIATLYGQPEKAAIFGYEKGATMDYETLAPARRVMMFLNNETFTNLSPAGLRLFDAAVTWAAGGPRA
nr:hypothetical protein [Novosphingobium sediminicola]